MKIITFAFSIVALAGSALYAAVIQGPVFNPANSNVYSLLTSNTWSGAESEAIGMNGKLTSIHNSTENDWVFDTFSGGLRNLWIGLANSSNNLAFNWVDGSALTYSNWDTANSQPNLGAEHWVFIPLGGLGHNLNARKWHDVIDDPNSQFPWIGPIFGVVAQTTPPNCLPHQATAQATVANGAIIGATVVDVGCGYTNTPVVLIQGAGGSGATAAAIMTNGVVIGVNIISPGCCYTTNPAPKISIASPPFVPTVTIAVSRVAVTQHVVLGRNYVLESSADLVNWAPTAPPFTADNEEIVTEFIVAQTGQYFRIRQMP